MASSAMSWVFRPSTTEGIREVFALARAEGLTVGLRGAGLSYGDAALNNDQVCLDLSRMNRILDWDPLAGVIRVEPGVTFRQLWQYAIEDGWWPPVVPGSMQVSLGGAAAVNIHGRNNWNTGPLGEHIVEFELLLPNGELVRCSPTQDTELFHGAISGFGLLGCFVSLTLRLKRIHSGLAAVEAITAPNLETMIRIFEERLPHADYLVGWLDCFARGDALGRGLVHQANDLEPGADPEPARTLRVENQGLPERLLGIVPRSTLWRAMRPFVNDVGMRLANTARYRLGARRHVRRFLQTRAAFAFHLDYVSHWKRAYGPGGLIQYQSFIPAAHALQVYTEQIRLLHARGVVPYLGVLKRHRPDAFLISHAVDGYSLALDIKLTARNRRELWALASELDRLVVNAGGRFYLAKDITLTRERYAGYLAEDRTRRFLALKHRCDPEALLQTDLYRRLFAGDTDAAPA